MPRLRPPSKEDSQLLPAFAALPDHAIYVPATPAEFAQARAALLAQTALGFDTESKPLFHVHQIDTGPHVVQLATPNAAWLLQLHHPQALALAREIIGHPGICKVGFGLDNDKSTLPKRLGVQMAHVLDLDRIFKQHGYGASTGVRAAVALVLGQNFHKSKKQSTSNWSLPVLSDAQIRYAANDAHGPAMVYAALAQWQARQPALAIAPRPPRDTAASALPAPPAPAPQRQQAAPLSTAERPRQAALFLPPKYQ
jgi:ribonuclease D